MPIRSALCTILITFGYLSAMEAQEVPIPQLKPGSARELASSAPSASAPLQFVALSVPTGTPLQVALDQEIHVRKVGQPIHGRIVEPVYAFDQIVIPIGSAVTGQVTKIGEISGGKRTAAALDADFTPERTAEVNFDDLVLADGRHFRLQSSVTPGSGQAIRFVAAAEGKEFALKIKRSSKVNETRRVLFQGIALGFVVPLTQKVRLAPPRRKAATQTRRLAVAQRLVAGSFGKAKAEASSS